MSKLILFDTQQLQPNTRANYIFTTQPTKTQLSNNLGADSALCEDFKE